MDQALETITRRINALGLTEPTIAFTGRADNEILVQLPGEGDPTRAKVSHSSWRTTPGTEPPLADEQTYPSEAAALAAHGGVLPLFRHTGCSGSIRGNGSNNASAGLLHRPEPRPDRDGRGFAPVPIPNLVQPIRVSIRFISIVQPPRRPGSAHFPKPTLASGWPLFYTAKSIQRQSLNSRIEDSGVIEGNFSARNLPRIWRLSCALAHFLRPSSIWKMAGGRARLSVPIQFERVCEPRSAASLW